MRMRRGGMGERTRDELAPLSRFGSSCSVNLVALTIASDPNELERSGL